MSNIILNLPAPPDGSKPFYPLDDPLLEHQLRFFKLKTGIEDSEELKRYICRIQEQAYQLFPFPCVWNFDFVRGKAMKHPMSRQVFETAQKQSVPQKIYVDFGAGLGSELRQIVHEGWKREDVLGIENKPEWVSLGHELFKDADQPIPYFIGDIFNPEVFEPSKPQEDPAQTVLDLFSLKDLNVLKGRVTVISANFFFHLFGEKDQERLVEYFSLLLSKEPGSSMIGMQRGTETEGFHSLPYAPDAHWYSHSADSWKKLLEKYFEPDRVKITAELKESQPDNQFDYIHGNRKVLWLYWSLTRLI